DPRRGRGSVNARQRSTKQSRTQQAWRWRFAVDGSWSPQCLEKAQHLAQREATRLEEAHVPSALALVGGRLVEAPRPHLLDVRLALHAGGTEARRDGFLVDASCAQIV